MQISQLFPLLLLAAVGCKSAEKAPVVGGESLTYAFSGIASNNGTVTIKADGSGFILDSGTPGFPAEKVDADLSDGRATVKMYYLGKLWLPASLRAVGSKVNVGDVTEHRKFKNWDVAVVAEHGGASGQRFFDLKTGFLVGLQISVGGSGYHGELRSATVPGLFE